LQLDDRADGGTSSGKRSKTVRAADSKSTTSDKALVSDEETAIVLAQPARFASEETMHGFRVYLFPWPNLWQTKRLQWRRQRIAASQHALCPGPPPMPWQRRGLPDALPGRLEESRHAGPTASPGADVAALPGQTAHFTCVWCGREAAHARPAGDVASDGACYPTSLCAACGCW